MLGQVAVGQTENDIFPIEGLPYPTLYTNVGQVRRYFIGTMYAGIFLVSSDTLDM